MALEDFRAPPDGTYTELDPQPAITVTANKLDVDALADNTGDTWVYDDKGAAHFGATFEHLVKATLQDHDDDWYRMYEAFWGVSNVVEDLKFWSVNTSEAVVCKFYGYHNVHRIYLWDYETAASDSWTGPVFTTPYWCTIQRTSSTAIQCRIYSDASRETLVDTLNVALTDGRTYQYIFAQNHWLTGSYGYAEMWYDVEDLDLQEAAAPPAAVAPGPFDSGWPVVGAWDQPWR